MKRLKTPAPEPADDLKDALARLLPHRGLGLTSRDGRLRWTDRLLAIVGVLMALSPGGTLLDRFEHAASTAAALHPTRRRPGRCCRGFLRRLTAEGGRVAGVVADHLRRQLERRARQSGDWLTGNFAVFCVDATQLFCPRTVANERGLGVAGTAGSAPQVKLSLLFHLGTGVPWAFDQDIGCCSERHRLLAMLDTLPPEAVILADAGYVGYDFFRAIVNSGRHFLVRGGSHLRFLRGLDARGEVHGDVVHLWPGKMQKHKGPPLRLRLLMVHDGRGREMALLTDVVDKVRLSDGEMVDLYRRRWQIELKYRSLKQTMARRHLRGRLPASAGVEAEFAALGLWMVEQLHYLAAGRADRSFAGVLRAVRSCISAAPVSDASRWRTRGASLAARLRAAVPDVLPRRSRRCRFKHPRRKRVKPQLPPDIRTATAKQVLRAQKLGFLAPAS